MSEKRVFEGQAISSELVVVILEKYGLHPTQRDTSDVTDPDDLERPTIVTVPEDEYETAQDLLFGQSHDERSEF